MRAKTVLALLVASNLTLAGAAPATAATPQVRVSIEVDDLAGAPVAGVTFTVWSSVASTTVTTDAYGNARARLAIAPNDIVDSDSDDPRLYDPLREFTDADDGDRFSTAHVANLAQGFEPAWAQADLDGDTVYDTVWHQARVGSNDRWIIQLSTGTVRDVRFGYYPVVSIFTQNVTDDPANELWAVEKLPGGQFRLHVYSEVADEKDRIDLGAVTALSHEFDDFDGDGLNDILFYSEETDPFEFTLVYSSDQSVAKFGMGTPGALFFSESTDVGGDGIADVVVAAASTDDHIWTTWWVWDSATRSVHLVELGVYSGQPGSEGMPDGDDDGLREFIVVSDIEGSENRIWEVYEYATGEYFAVELGPEDDRGPSSEHYAPSWFD